MRRILGLDPGLRHTGWGVVEIRNNVLQHIANGVVSTTDKQPLSFRLAEIFNALKSIITHHTPLEAAVEETFVNKNPFSTLKLGMARGVVLMAPELHGLQVFEYSANKVKKSVVGAGHASKEQIAHMVKVLLPKAGDVKLDAADALAVALCHAHHHSYNGEII